MPVVWKCFDGRVIRVVDMDHYHMRNCVRMVCESSAWKSWMRRRARLAYAESLQEKDRDFREALELEAEYMLQLAGPGWTLGPKVYADAATTLERAEYIAEASPVIALMVKRLTSEADWRGE